MAYPLRELFNALLYIVRCGSRAGYDGYKRRKSSKVHIAVDTLTGMHWLAFAPRMLASLFGKS